MARKKQRQMRLDRTVASIQHKWGEEALHKGASRTRPAPHIATGFPQLDQAIGIGGVPRGKITLLSGRATSGKGTLAALILARAQAKGRAVAIIDLMHTSDADYLQRCGVRLADLLVVQPRNSREALDLALSLAGRPELAAILFDHWGALGQERKLQRYADAILGQLVGELARSGVAFLVLEESRWRWRRPGWGHSALAHYSALHLRFDREQWYRPGPDVRGYRARVTLAKNKFGPAGHSVAITIHFNGTVQGQGI